MTDSSGKHGFRRGLTNYGDRAFASICAARSPARWATRREMLRQARGRHRTSPPAASTTATAHMPELVEAVKRGVLAAGALPIEFPTISLGEAFLNPTSLMFRNLMSMDVEEMIRAQPMDAVVLVGGCDKTVPAQLMGAASAGVPAIQLVAGPMMTGRHRGERLGACTDCRRFWARYRAGEIERGGDRRRSSAAWRRRPGTCAVMGTASTMACTRRGAGHDAAGQRPPFRRSHADRLRMAEATGRGRGALLGAATAAEPDHHARSRSRTRCACCSPSAARPTRSSISRPSPGASACSRPCGVSTSSATRRRCSSTSSPPAQHYMEDFHAAGGMPRGAARAARRCSISTA